MSDKKKYYPPLHDFYAKRNLPPPASISHGTEADLQEKMRQLKPKQWVLKGNQLEGMTEMGKVVCFIPTNYICRGSDEKGLPILEKIDNT